MVSGVMIERSYAKGSLLFLEGEPGLYLSSTAVVLKSANHRLTGGNRAHIYKDSDIFAEVVYLTVDLTLLRLSN